MEQLLKHESDSQAGVATNAPQKGSDARSREGEAQAIPRARVVIVRSTPIDPEPRARKAAAWLAESGWLVNILGWDRWASLPQKEKCPGYTIFRLPIKAGFGLGLRLVWPLVRWQVAVFAWLLRHRREYEIIHAADFDTVIPCLLAARLSGKCLVYDIYDFYAHSHLLPPGVRGLVAVTERWVARHADRVIVVDESRRQQIDGVRPERIEVIYNSPDSIPLPMSPKPPGRLRVAYVGILAAGRMLDELLDLMAKHPEWELDFAGFGWREKPLVEKAAGLPNARFHGRTPYTRTLEINGQSDVMVALYDPTIPNHHFSSPNKLFEAMMLGKPVVVARDTGVDEVVGRHGVGFVVPYGDLAALSKVFSEVAAWDGDESKRFARRARQVYEEHFSGRLMRERLSHVYAALASGCRNATR